MYVCIYIYIYKVAEVAEARATEAGTIIISIHAPLALKIMTILIIMITIMLRTIMINSDNSKHE